MNSLEKALQEYIQKIASKFSRQETSEYGYRTDFENLLSSVFESLRVKRIAHDPKAEKGNKPDFIVYNDEIPILYIEAKPIGESLDKVEKSEQMRRYFGYPNLVLTDYIEFRFYRNGVRYEEPIKIANYSSKEKTIEPLPENYEHLRRSLLEFSQANKDTIRSAEHLSRIMGGKAQRIRDNIREFLSTESEKNDELKRIYETIKKLLVHDLSLEKFADLYAQTVVYGLFAARYHDESQDTFSRQEARDLVPASNPLLRHFFDHIVGPDFDKRLEYIVNELCEVFSHANVRTLMKQYFKENLWGDTNEGPDPVIHFYEDFLKEYDPLLRKQMGAYYTPLPVVRFIVRTVDDALKKDFGLTQGLADSSKNEDFHRVQILDPAVGTGTFLTETIHSIYKRFKSQEGRWPAYVHNDLLPRLHGFELMMAPYTIAHLKLGMVLRETGFKYFNRRLGIYLTNSLEVDPYQPELLTFGLAESIAQESKEAQVIKTKTPIMVVIGNPPYSAASSNETKYANSLVAKYKVEPGGKLKLQERKHWLNDDYVKFIALAEEMIIKNGEGVVGFITNHGYLDNPTFRGMRWHLTKTFDKIHIIDLHGNAKKKEFSPDGSKDENIFDIQTGVAIMIAEKTRRKGIDVDAKIYHSDLFGLRSGKFKALEKGEIKWKELKIDKRSYNFKPGGPFRDKVYENGIRIDELFRISSTGIFTLGDSFIVSMDKSKLKARIEGLIQEGFNVSGLNAKFNLGKNYAKWIGSHRRKLEFDNNKMTKIVYRPFDERWVYFDSRFIWRPRAKISSHFITFDNIGLSIGRQGSVVGDMPWNLCFATKRMVDLNLFYRGGEQMFPLYLYNADREKTLNFEPEVLKRFTQNIGNSYKPEDIIDYIYAVLYSPAYREKYKVYLKTDFPKIPYPKDKKNFKQLTKLGRELRELHLFESPALEKLVTTFPVAESGKVERVEYVNNTVYINEKQYFGKVPEVAWNFYIGGYQPAQKWLKDRKGKELSNEELEHYQKIIVTLVETDRIMKEIDKIKFF